MIALRPALPLDIDALWALRTLAVRISCATHYSAEQVAVWSASPVPAGYADLLAAGGGIVAVHDGVIASYAMLDLDQHEVDAVFVDPAQGGLGIGKRLLRRWKTWRASMGLNGCICRRRSMLCRFTRRRGLSRCAKRRMRTPAA